MRYFIHYSCILTEIEVQNEKPAWPLTFKNHKPCENICYIDIKIVSSKRACSPIFSVFEQLIQKIYLKNVSLIPILHPSLTY